MRLVTAGCTFRRMLEDALTASLDLSISPFGDYVQDLACWIFYQITQCRYGVTDADLAAGCRHAAGALPSSSSQPRTFQLLYDRLDARINFPALLPRDIREISPNLPCTSYANPGLSIGRQIQGKCQATVRLEMVLWM